jgi:hypothetical protein
MNFIASTKFYIPENTANRPMPGFQKKSASKGRATKQAPPLMRGQNKNNDFSTPIYS